MQYYVYIMTNKNNSVFYTGVTNDLTGSVNKHKEKSRDGFTTKHNINKLVYYEAFNSIYHAVSKVKQIKNSSGNEKIILINNKNKEWKDLSDEL